MTTDVWSTRSGRLTNAAERVLERTDHVVEADASESDPSFGGSGGIADQHDRSAGIEDVAGELGESTLEADVHRPRRCPDAKSVGSRVSRSTAPPSRAFSVAARVIGVGAPCSSSSSRASRFRPASNAKYLGAVVWPSVTAATNASSLMGCSA